MTQSSEAKKGERERNDEQGANVYIMSIMCVCTVYRARVVGRASGGRMAIPRNFF